MPDEQTVNCGDAMIIKDGRRNRKQKRRKRPQEGKGKRGVDLK
jgi:hypothetical protein